MADKSTTIIEIESIQDAGASSVSVDGVSVSYDLGELRRRKRELQNQDDTQATRRPRLSTVNLGKGY